VFFQFVMKGLAKRRDIRLGGTRVGYVGNPGDAPIAPTSITPSCAFKQNKTLCVPGGTQSFHKSRRAASITRKMEAKLLKK